VGVRGREGSCTPSERHHRFKGRDTVEMKSGTAPKTQEERSEEARGNGHKPEKKALLKER